MFRRADDWLLARAERALRYLERYFSKSGKHRPERIFS